MRVSILRDVNSLLAASERDAGIAGLVADFSSKSCCTLSNGLFLNSDVSRVLKGKDYRAMDLVFLITEIYIDRATALQKDANRTGFHRLYSDTMSKVVSQNHVREWSVARLETLCSDICAYNHMLVNMFLHACPSVLFTLKFHLLFHRIEDISSFENLWALDASPQEYYITGFNAAYRHTYQRSATRLNKMMFDLDQM